MYKLKTKYSQNFFLLFGLAFLFFSFSFAGTETSFANSLKPVSSKAKAAKKQASISPIGKNQQRFRKQCRRIGQKYCRVDAPGYSGRCKIFSRYGHYVIFYKVYPKKIKRIVCLSRLR